MSPFGQQKRHADIRHNGLRMVFPPVCHTAVKLHHGDHQDKKGDISHAQWDIFRQKKRRQLIWRLYEFNVGPETLVFVFGVCTNFYGTSTILSTNILF
jgi:hypothetical protein